MTRMYSDEIAAQANEDSRRFGDRLFEVGRYNAERKRLQPMENLEMAKSMAALQDDGYNYDQNTNTLSRNEQFGQVPTGFTRAGGKVVQDPTYVNPKDQLDIDEKQWKKEQRQRFGGGPSFGAMPSSSAPSQPATFGGGASGDYWYNPINDKLEETPDFKLRQKREEEAQKPLSGESAVKFEGARQSMQQIADVTKNTNEQNFPKMKKGVGNIRMARTLGLNAPGSIKGNFVKSLPIVGPIVGGMFKTDDEQKRFELGVNLVAENNVRAKSGAAVPDPEQVKEEARQLLADDSFVAFQHRMAVSDTYSKGMMESIRPGSTKQFGGGAQAPKSGARGGGDAFIKEAKAAGISDEEIRAYLESRQ